MFQSFDIQTEEVDGGVVESQQETVEREALLLDGVFVMKFVLLWQDCPHHVPQTVLAVCLPEQGHVRPGVSGQTDRTGPGSPPG